MCVYVYVRIDRGIEWKSKKKIIERPLEIRRRKGFTRPMERDRHRYARPKRRVRKSCFFSDRKSERGSKSKKKKKKRSTILTRSILGKHVSIRGGIG